MSADEVLADRVKEYRELLELSFSVVLVYYSQTGNDAAGRLLEKLIDNGIGDTEQKPLLDKDDYGQGNN